MFKVGQEVVCIGTFKREAMDDALGVVFPEINKTYTIRQLTDGSRGLYLMFEEILNPKVNTMYGVMEVRFSAKKFRPLDYDFVEEVIKQVEPKEELV